KDRLAYSALMGGIWTLALEEQGGQWKPGKPEPFLDHGGQPAFSPDGRWIADVEGGDRQGGRGKGFGGRPASEQTVFVRPFPPPPAGQESRKQIANGLDPRWKGQELLYRSGDQIMAQSYTVTGNDFKLVGKPRVYISKLGGATEWDLAPGG